jgi:hypothetical protein
VMPDRSGISEQKEVMRREQRFLKYLYMFFGDTI